MNLMKLSLNKKVYHSFKLQTIIPQQCFRQSTNSKAYHEFFFTKDTSGELITLVKNKNTLSQDHFVEKAVSYLKSNQGKVNATDVFLVLNHFRYGQEESDLCQALGLKDSIQLIEEVVGRPQVQASDALLIALGLAQWAKKRQDEDISGLKGVEERYQQLFEKIDDHVIAAFNEANQNMYEEIFRFSLHTLISGAKANIFSQKVYDQSVPAFQSFARHLGTTFPQKPNSRFDHVRIFNAFLRAQSFSESFDHPLRRAFLHNTFVKDFSHLSNLDLILLLHGQHALTSPILSDKREYLSFDRILKRLESRCKDLTKHITDQTNLKKLYLGLSLVEWDQGIGLHKSQVPNIVKFYEDKLRPQFEKTDGKSEQYSLAGKSDSQKKFNRLIKQAFVDEQGVVTPEVSVGLYQIDILLEVKQRNLQNIAIEISDPETKYFRTHYPTPGHRIRNKYLRNKGYQPVEISTSFLPNFDSLSETDQKSLIRDYILNQFNSR